MTNPYEAPKAALKNDSEPPVPGIVAVLRALAILGSIGMSLLGLALVIPVTVGLAYYGAVFLLAAGTGLAVLAFGIRNRLLVWATLAGNSLALVVAGYFGYQVSSTSGLLGAFLLTSMFVLNIAAILLSRRATASGR